MNDIYHCALTALNCKYRDLRLCSDNLYKLENCSASLHRIESFSLL